MNNDHINPGYILKIVGIELLIKEYYKIFEKWTELNDIIWKSRNLSAYNFLPYEDYLRKLIHEGASFADIAINILENISYYKKNIDKTSKKTIEEMTHKAYHNLMLFFIFYESLSIFYDEIHTKKEK